jgi:hypothetical protein
MDRVVILLVLGCIGVDSALMPWRLVADVVDYALISKPELSRRPAKRALAFGK